MLVPILETVKTADNTSSITVRQTNRSTILLIHAIMLAFDMPDEAALYGKPLATVAAGIRLLPSVASYVALNTTTCVGLVGTHAALEYLLLLLVNGRRARG